MVATKLAADLKPFAVGARVEVSSGDALLPATIVAPRKNGFEVEYYEVEEHGSKKKKKKRPRSTEHVEAAAVSPSAPREGAGFAPGEEVDALYRGAWREGVVVREVGETGRFWVHLRAASEQVELSASEMRVHREWVRGRWVPPLQEDDELSSSGDFKTSKERKTGKVSEKKKLRKGMLVEVSMDEDGFRGSWYAATILEVVDKTKYRVQYKSLRRESDKEFVVEEFHAKNVRPYPPEAIVVDSFSLNESIEVLYNDGWWEGVISKVLKQGRYRVYFKANNTELVFDYAYLRPRQDWINGVWVMASD